MYCMSLLHVCTCMYQCILPTCAFYSTCGQNVWLCTVDVCVCMSYSPGSDDKPGGGTQVLIAIHM